MRMMTDWFTQCGRYIECLASTYPDIQASEKLMQSEIQTDG